MTPLQTNENARAANTIVSHLISRPLVKADSTSPTTAMQKLAASVTGRLRMTLPLNVEVQLMFSVFTRFASTRQHTAQVFRIFTAAQIHREGA